MASGDLSLAPRRDWFLAQPWFWMGAGLVSSVTAGLFNLGLGDQWIAFRVFLLCLGLLSAGIALTLRFCDSGPAAIERLPLIVRQCVLVGLLAIYGLLAIACTVSLLFAIFGMNPLVLPGQNVVLWLLIVPLSIAGLQVICARLRDGEVSRGEEASALLTLSALVCFVCARALDHGDLRYLENVTLRVFLAALMLAALVAAPLMVVPQNIRRAVVSFLVLFHFGGICTAGLAAPPTPWAVAQLWSRIYRPYLEFMYLNNAYHFYAPEPGPNSYVWFRITYTHPATKRDEVHWLKIPKVDDEGFPQYPVALIYQRMLSLTQNVDNVDGLTPNEEIYRRRKYHTPAAEIIVGVKQPELRIPMHPGKPELWQFRRPNMMSKYFLRAYVRHVATLPHPDPDKADWTFKSVKVYRVVHEIAVPSEFIRGMKDPLDWENYTPVYMGDFNADGQLQNPDEPFLYWMLPMVRKSPRSNFIRSYMHKHAGDPNWVFDVAAKEWVRSD